MAKQQDSKTSGEKSPQEKAANKAAGDKVQTADERGASPASPASGPAPAPRGGAETSNVAENVALLREAEANPPAVKIGPDISVDPKEVSTVNKDNFPGGGNPESPEFRAAMGKAVPRGDATRQPVGVKGATVGLSRAENEQQRARVQPVGDEPSDPRSEPLFIVKRSFLTFAEGEQLPLSRVVKAGADPEFLLGNGSLQPMNAGGLQLMGVVESNGLPHIDLVSHEQALTAVRAQAEADFNQRAAEMQRELDSLRRERAQTGGTFERHAEEVEKLKKGAKEEAERSSKFETENMELREDNEALRRELETLRASAPGTAKGPGELTPKNTDLPNRPE